MQAFLSIFFVWICAAVAVAIAASFLFFGASFVQARAPRWTADFFPFVIYLLAVCALAYMTFSAEMEIPPTAAFVARLRGLL